MFDLSFPELAVVALLALLVFGPQELGRIMYGLGRIMRRLHYLRFALSQQFEDFMQKAGENDPAAQVNFEARRGPEFVRSGAEDLPPSPENKEKGEEEDKREGGNAP